MEYQRNGTRYTHILDVCPKKNLCKPKSCNNFNTISSRSANYSFSTGNVGNSDGVNDEERFYITGVNKRQRQSAKTAPIASKHDTDICTFSLCIFVNSLCRNVINVIPFLFLLMLTVFLHVNVYILFQNSIKFRSNSFIHLFHVLRNESEMWTMRNKEKLGKGQK